MSGFKFVRRKNKFYWQNDLFRIEFSSPSCQAHDDYGYISKPEDIMYFYYTVKVYRSKKCYKDIDEETYVTIPYWSLVSQTSTHDFPCIEQLLCILELFHDDNEKIKDGGEKHEYRSGNVSYSKHYHSEGFGSDDFYEITKYYFPEDGRVYFNVYIGASVEAWGWGANSVGVRIANCQTKDMRELEKCVKAFLQYTYYLHNKGIDKMVEDAKTKYEVVENKLYEYSMINYRKVDTSAIETIYAIGDEIEGHYFVEKEGKISSIEFPPCYIREFKGDIVVCECKHPYHYGEKNPQFIEFDIHSIGYIHNEVSDEVLKYTLDEIVEEFFNVMTTCEKNDFLTQDDDYLLHKYRSAIIDRTWMCREEHGFEETYKDYMKDDGRVDMSVVVLDVIKKVQIQQLTT